MSQPDWKVTPYDTDILRGLAERVRAHADSDANRALRELWYLHDECRGRRPLILAEHDAGIEMVLGAWTPACREPWAQQQERDLVTALAHAETIRDDWVVEPWVALKWRIGLGDYGVETHATQPQTEGHRGAYHIDAAIADLAAEFHRLRPRVYRVDRERTLGEQALLRDVYGGVLDVEIRGHPWWTLGLTWDAIKLIGLEGLMMAMYDAPDALHRLMAFLRDDRLCLLDWMEREGLLTLNNANDYIGSGSRGYTRRLPQPDLAPGSPVRARDIWGLLESQETVGVGPEQYAEFVFPCEDAIARRVGAVYYGCCEPLHARWAVVKGMANLRRVSVSPWCDEARMAAALGDRYVYSRKPNPSLVSTERFDEALIREDLRKTVRLTREHGCTAEIVMKDVHTLHGEPGRLARWVRLARETVREAYGDG